MKKTLSRGLAGALCVGLMIGSCVSVGAEGETADNLGKILFLQTHNNNYCIRRIKQMQVLFMNFLSFYFNIFF